MSDDFIKMINDIDLLYGFIYECNDLVNICTITIIMII